MKKFLLTFASLSCLVVYQPASAANVECTQTGGAQWCLDNGYKKASGNNCAGVQSDDIIRCPFDTTYVSCRTINTKECTIGDIVYDDGNCYVGSGNVSGRHQRGVVFDPVNKLALQLVETSNKSWQKTFYGYETTAWGITHSGNIKLGEESYCEKNDEQQTYFPKCDTSDEDPECTGNFCYSLICPVTRGCHIRGIGSYLDGQLPASLIPPQTCKQEETGKSFEEKCTGGFSAFGPGFTPRILPTLNLTVANPEDMAKSYTSKDYTVGGYADTKILATEFPSGSYKAEAAVYCNNLNTSPSYSSASERANGRLWFLPSSGDIWTLVQNINEVQNALTTKIGNCDSYWTSTQAYSYSGENKWWQLAWFGRPITKQSDGSDCEWTVNFGTADRNQTERKTRCVYHYGDNWAVPASETNSAAYQVLQQLPENNLVITPVMPKLDIQTF